MRIAKKAALASLVAASGLLIAAAPGSTGASTSTSTSTAPARASVSETGPAQGVDPDRRICIHVAFTGSRAVRRVCKTARAWEAEGGIPAEDR